MLHPSLMAKRDNLSTMDRAQFAGLLLGGFEDGGERRKITAEYLAQKHWRLLNSADDNVVQRELHWIEERVLGLGRSSKVSELPPSERDRLDRYLVELSGKVPKTEPRSADEHDVGEAAGSA